MSPRIPPNDSVPDDERHIEPEGERAKVPAVAPGEPPVVARLIVEVRSDGTTTVARGAMEDAESGQRVLVEARGTTPLALALGLARSILAAPWLAGASKAARALLRR
ncbi:MAG TPA: hypothetical protein VKY73_00950 [Polyangiaceae bacterium]|nr:hypothetical protein [Polyangiaceae bacterium]